VIVLIWGFICLYQAIGTVWFPHEYFGFRAWESATIGRTDGLFVPYYKWDDLSSGDLGNMAGVPQLRQKRHQVFTTDEYGFRNPVGISDRTCDVVIVGDSFAVGSKSSDDEILSELIRNETGLNVYNYAAASLSYFFGDKRFIEKKPRLIILLLAERNVHPYSVEYRPLDPFTLKKFPPIFADPGKNRKKSFDNLREMLTDSRVLKHHAEGVYKGLLYMLGLYAFPETIFYHDRSSGMLFYRDGGLIHLTPESWFKVVDDSLPLLKKWSDAFKKRGSVFLVLVVPDKVTVYHEMIPSINKQNATRILDRLNDGLSKLGIAHVRLHDVFLKYVKAHPDEFIYYKDDTHPNSSGYRLIFNAIKSKLPLATD
jgi:hypothetical protein